MAVVDFFGPRHRPTWPEVEIPLAGLRPCLGTNIKNLRMDTSYKRQRGLHSLLNVKNEDPFAFGEESH